MKRASQKQFHFVYKTTCKTTGRFYIGLHSTDDINDSYLGSGKRLIRSVNKYGHDDHVREILKLYPSRIDASDGEKSFITEEMLNNPMCMNCGPGGLGATDRPATSDETRAKLSAASKKVVRTKDWYDKIVASRLANGTRYHTNETKAKIAESGRGRVLTDEQKQKISASLTGQKRTAETCANISAAKKGKSPAIKRPFTQEHKDAIRRARIGKKHSDEAKDNMRKAKARNKSLDEEQHKP